MTSLVALYLGFPAALLGVFGLAGLGLALLLGRSSVDPENRSHCMIYALAGLGFLSVAIGCGSGAFLLVRRLLELA